MTLSEAISGNGGMAFATLLMLPGSAAYFGYGGDGEGMGAPKAGSGVLEGMRLEAP
jgi:hypothetical protein